MSAQAFLPPDQNPGATMTTSLMAALVLACGVLVANLYQAQPLVASIGEALGGGAAARGLLVTLSQIGYGLGLILIVPCGDLIENRRLIVLATVLDGLALAGMSVASSSLLFLVPAFAVGLLSVTVQIIVPLAAHLTADARRGRVVGNLASGMMLGIMLARPLASFVAPRPSDGGRCLLARPRSWRCSPPCRAARCRDGSRARR